MATVNDLLKTPQDFITEETEKLKTYLSDHTDVQINKLGLVGFTINLLGNIRYDATQYYQNLFIESNIATARDENNLYMHSALYGYTPSFASPSTADGTFSFDFANLAIDLTSVKRTVTFKEISFMNGDIQFSTDTVYKFVQENQSYYVIVYLSDGTINHIPASSSLIVAPFFNVYQKTQEIESIIIPNYDYLSYYSQPFTTGDEYLSDISVYIKERGKSYTTKYGDEFDVKLVKYLETSTSHSCFLKMNSSTSFILEFGSGIRGKYIPNSTATIIKNLTHAEDGQINVESTMFPLSNSKLILRTYSTLPSYNENYLSNKLLTVNFLNSNNGINPVTGNELRTNIIKHIQTREFLIDKQDYENLTNVDDNEFVYSFKKSAIQRNDFYLYQILRDENQLPVKSFCVNFPSIDITGSIQNISYTSLNESDGELLPDTYIYTVYACDKFHISLTSTFTVTITDSYNAIQLDWDNYDYAQTYLLMVYNGVTYRHFIINTNTFIDIGQPSDSQSNFINIFDSDITYSWEDVYIFFPEFELNSTTFISPFVYKYNSFMNWFDCNLFYDDFIVLFSQKNPITSIVNQNYTVPQFHLRIQFDYINKRTRFIIISPQDCSSYACKLTVFGTTILDTQLTRLLTNSYYIDYEETDSGILFGEFTADLSIYYCDATDTINSSVLTYYTTTGFKQIQPINDQIKIISYIDDIDSTHLLSIPVLEKSVYESDTEAYNLKLLSNIYDTGLSQKRFPNDEIQYRFLNTYYVENKYFRNIIKQNYDFVLYLPLLLTVDIIFNEDYINNTVINISTEKDNLYMLIASKLQSTYTGHMINFHNSQLIDFIHNDRPFIKSVAVQITDSNENDINYGIESYDEDTVMENIQSDTFDTDEGNTKTNIAYYNPAYFWWDVDNIIINYTFN